MKIHLKVPGGGEFHMEREPMSEDRFDFLSMLAAIGGCLFFLYQVLALLV